MLLALEAGLSGNDYVFFHLDLFGQSLQGAHGLAPRRPWERGDGQDVSAHQAFRVRVQLGSPGCGALGCWHIVSGFWVPQCLKGFQKRSY